MAKPGAITRQLVPLEVDIPPLEENEESLQVEHKETYRPQHNQHNEHGIHIDALHLKRFGNKQSILLNDITIAIPPGKLVGVVGRSGTGKSTLIEALNGLRPAQQGNVFYSGQDYYRNISTFRTQLGYVPQEDIVHRELTVERALYYAARLRLPSTFTEAQIRQRIDEVLEDMEITHRRSLLVGKLSGGQRKRVSIAMELLANPRVFFLDEPTSGLDPDLDRKMMLRLRDLADRGRTIVVTTHATANINVCDYICFLAEGGRLAYFGPPKEALAYFDKTNFAEIYATLEPTDENPLIPEEVEARFKSSPDYQKYVVELLNQDTIDTDHPNTSRGITKKVLLKYSTMWSQFVLLTLRTLELLKNDRVSLLILLLQAPTIGLILMLLVRYEIGVGIFDTKDIIQCPTTAQILTTTGFIDTPVPLHPALSTDCNRVDSFLKNNPQGKVYATHRGGERKALQDFMVTGPGTDAQKVLFIMAFTAVMFGCINSLKEIVKELPIYRRERAVNLGILPYIFSKITVLGGLCLLQSAVLVLAINIVSPFHQGIVLPAYLEAYITMTLTALAGMMLGLTVSAAVSNNSSAMSFLPLILVPQVIFSGTVFPLKDWPSQIVGALFAARWGMIALGSSVGLHSDKLINDKLFGSDYTYHGILCSIYSQADAAQHLLLMWAALAGMLALLNVALVMFLKQKDVRR